MLAEVIVCRNVPKRYTYSVPETGSYSIGDHVEIPFGKSLAVGIIYDLIDTKPPENCKDLGEKLIKKPQLTSTLLNFIDWLTEEYNITPHKAYQTIMGKMKIRELPEQNDETITLDKEKTPNDEQKVVIKTILENENQSFLIHGVTSSGKTEVYMQIANQIIQNGQSVLMLLPEIALTPQMRKGFKARFGERVSVIHSGLTPKQREIEWNRIYNQTVSIVIGPRSAIFTPLENIGLIILDEEHDNSYKQDNNPRYTTHHIAEYRRQTFGARLLYGSATPGLELFYKASMDQTLTLLQMKHRATPNPLPTIDIIDMTQKHNREDHPLLSSALLNGIESNIEKKQKTLILLNRRGYAPYIICQSCHKIHTCPECNLSYTYHKDRVFRCHRCDRSDNLTHTCKHCKKPHLNFGGIGTQKVEAELLKLFPGIKICRLDKDTNKSVKELEKTLETFENEGDILIGTQMIAKGHHFEGVTLVGVLGIDSSLNLADFRAGERTYQLLSQVAGRAGRGKEKGHVIIQTSNPDHYVIQHALTHNYEAFYADEIEFRKELKYPPFSDLIHIICSGKINNQTKETIETLHSFIKKKTTNLEDSFCQIIGPKPAPIEKIKDHFRWHMLIKADTETFNTIKQVLKYPPKTSHYVKVIIDYHPKTIL